MKIKELREDNFISISVDGKAAVIPSTDISYLSDENKASINHYLGDFLAKPNVEGDKVRFVIDKLGAKPSKSVETKGRIPKKILQDFKKAWQEISSSMDSFESNSRRLFENFLLPDPKAHPECYRLFRVGGKTRLFIIWGLISPQKGLSVDEVLNSFSSGDVLLRKSASKYFFDAILILCFFIIASYAYTTYNEQYPRYLERNKVLFSSFEHNIYTKEFREKVLAISKSDDGFFCDYVFENFGDFGDVKSQVYKIESASANIVKSFENLRDFEEIKNIGTRFAEIESELDELNVYATTLKGKISENEYNEVLRDKFIDYIKSQFAKDSLELRNLHYDYMENHSNLLYTKDNVFLIKNSKEYKKYCEDKDKYDISAFENHIKELILKEDFVEASKALKAGSFYSEKYKDRVYVLNIKLNEAYESYSKRNQEEVFVEFEKSINEALANDDYEKISKILKKDTSFDSKKYKTRLDSLMEKTNFSYRNYLIKKIKNVDKKSYAETNRDFAEIKKSIYDILLYNNQEIEDLINEKLRLKKDEIMQGYRNNIDYLLVKLPNDIFNQAFEDFSNAVLNKELNGRAFLSQEDNDLILEEQRVLSHFLNNITRSINIYNCKVSRKREIVKEGLFLDDKGLRNLYLTLTYGNSVITTRYFPEEEGSDSRIDEINLFNKVALYTNSKIEFNIKIGNDADLKYSLETHLSDLGRYNPKFYNKKYLILEVAYDILVEKRFLGTNYTELLNNAKSYAKLNGKD